jgi:long-chain acyl-CoA synthetase
VVADSIPARLFQQTRERPHAPAYRVRENGRWRTTTWRRYGAEVREAARALIALGFEPGSCTCLIGFNRPEWVIFDLATMAVGGVPAGIYTTCSPEEVQYIASHTEATVILIEDEGQWKKLEQERTRLPALETVVMMKGGAEIDDDMVLSWEEFIEKGADVDDAKVEERLDALDPNALATLIYTSGTTGPPKGVMLSHSNLTWTATAARDLVDIRSNDESLSYLPLSHIAEQMFSIHSPITAGYVVSFAESIDEVPNNLKEVQPTIFFGVPRIWEKFYAGVSGKMADATGVKKHLLDGAMRVGREVTATRQSGRPLPPWLEKAHQVADKVIYSKLKPAIGLGRVRFCVTGAAPIATEILEFFASLDILVMEVYGQSEDSGPTSFNRPDKFLLGSVGPAIPGVQVKIAEDGEILVKGPNVFMGYYKDEAATRDTLKEGWLHSGDLGELDADGFLHITGRKKDIIITAGGKNIAPKNLENGLKNHPLINEAVVIGDRRKYLTVLVTLDPDATKAWLDKNGGGDPAKAHEHTGIKREVQKALDELNPLFARVEQLKKFTILSRNLTIEDGELTPTLKVKRSKVSDHFEGEIEAMYAD